MSDRLRSVLRPMCAATALAAALGVCVGSVQDATAQSSEAQPTSVNALPNSPMNPKLRGELRNVVQQAAAKELIPVSIIMREQVDRGVLATARLIPNKADRRTATVEALKTLADRSQTDLRAMLADAVARNEAAGVRPLWIHNAIRADLTADVIMSVANRGDVAYINWNEPIPAKDIFPVEPEDGNPGIEALECGVDLMDADRVWDDFGYRGEGILVGHIDSGVCRTHPDIQNQIWNNDDEIPSNGIDDDNNGYIDDTWGWAFDLNNNNPDDFYSHGSHTAGTVAGDGASGTECGMAPNAEVMVLRISGSFGGEGEVWEATQYAVDNDADLITASLGWPHSASPDRATWRSVNENAMAAGVVVIYAAGNEGCGTTYDNVRTPGDVPDMITVGATDCSDNIASFSSCGPVEWEFVNPYNDYPYPPGKMKPTISAPGLNTTSHSLCGGYTQFSGTSMATPHVAGAVALMLQANPSLDHYDIKQLLQDTSVDLGPSGRDNTFGAGRVDAYEAVLAASNGGPSMRISQPEPGFWGRENFISVTRAEPNERVQFVYSLRTGTASVPGCPDLTLDLSNPKFLGKATADSNGDATFGFFVPSAADGLTTYFQAGQLSQCTKSNRVEFTW